MSKPFYVPLPHRGLINIEGEDRLSFLQGLISQNIMRLENSHILYGCLLTPQGKFLHDFFLHHGDEFILIDCEGGHRAEDLYNRLNKYRLRARVQISLEPHHAVYSLFNADEGLPDPRHFKMGSRSFEKPQDMEAESFEEWDMQRIILGIPDGSRDMEVERSTLLEMNIDKVNGVDFDKGCYMGQELTARMHHRNLGKKHLRVVKFIKGSPPPPFSDIEINGKVVGNMRSSCRDVGLAVVKDEDLEGLKYDDSAIRLLG
ncbi:MAG: folate-binding protein [Alphaproteobacteria bacterium]|nr:folate-binding protein [Alphaproteobacteria bacterium]